MALSRIANLYLAVFLKVTTLEPLLFIHYINDLPNCLVNSHPRMYADDTHLTFNDVAHLEENMNDDRTKIIEWIRANKLTLNKSIYVDWFKAKVKCFYVHTEHISHKNASGIGILKRSRSFVLFETLLCIHNALVQPHFDYCNVVWGNCNISFHETTKTTESRGAYFDLFFT